MSVMTGTGACPPSIGSTKAALRKLPPLIKGYVRAGAFIGEGAVIDRQFGTTDVLIYFPVSQIGKRLRTRLTDGRY